MWPFNNKDKERAEKLEAQLQDLLDKEQARQEREAEEARKIQEAIDEANKKERLIQEEKERQEAAKNLATEREEPYINIINIEMDPESGATLGAIEMDWNEYFIKMLQQNGYIGVSDEDAVDQWFRDVCRHVVLETYENENAGQTTNREDIGDGRAEYS